MKAFIAGLVIVAYFTLGTVGTSVPHTNCASGRSVFTVTNFDVSPSPPIIGKDVTVSVSINSAEVVTGGKATVEITGGPFPYSQTINICGNKLVQCPIPKGKSSLTLTRKIPVFIPPGTYGIKVSAVDNAGKNLICTSAQITLKRSSMALRRFLSKLFLRYLTH